LEILLAHQFISILNRRLISVIEIAKRFGIHFYEFALICFAVCFAVFATFGFALRSFAVCFATLRLALLIKYKIDNQF